MPGQTDKTYAIHPAIGVARLGNAQPDMADPSTYYLGPETPYQVANVGQPYKVGGKLKKQAQRFRIYELQNGKATREVTLDQADVARIAWTVHLSNRKAALDTDAKFGSVSAPAVKPSRFWPAATRNRGVPVPERSDLGIDPGGQSVSDPGSQKDLTGSITFRYEEDGRKRAAPSTKAVTLGKLYMEPGTGRLLVFGGSGVSEGLDKEGQFTTGASLDEFVNNSNWYDDSSDGRVQAVVTFTDGTSIKLDQPQQTAWVLCSAPKYTPGFGYFTTLHDVAVNAARSPDAEIPRPSFTRDIYPILRSVSMLQWVSAKGALGHGTGKRGNYLQEGRMPMFADNNPAKDSVACQARRAVFERIRNPAGLPEHPQPNQMPNLSDEVVQSLDEKTKPVDHYDISCLTPLQYGMLKKWRDGDFDADYGGAPCDGPLDSLDIAAQPAALDLGALQGTAGAPLYPGIESWLIARSPELYAAPLRVAGIVKPGDLTMGNALPWQADYLDCNNSWWPVQRPTNVTRGGKLLESWEPREWGAGGDDADYNQMVRNWWRMGFVVSKNDGRSYEEAEQTEEGTPG